MARALASGIDVGARVAVDERAGERAVDQDRQLARGRGEGFGLADAHGQAAIEGAERRRAPDQAQGGDPEDRGGAIGGEEREPSTYKPFADLANLLKRNT